ncbi:MAG TPA: RusA family crossover junction endodeoxyribonuclease, partial [Planctomycetaceae bacterium]|nr:RusA family crossover junction endodeoxyribonuclease [Planctomycetaceae bacterium]
EMPRVPHTSRPDLDNLVKSTKDALNGLAWRDDSQVVELSAGKCYASGNELPGVEIAIEIAHDCTLLRGEE